MVNFFRHYLKLSLFLVLIVLVGLSSQYSYGQIDKYRITVKFDSITVNNDHDHQLFPIPHPSDCCSGEWSLGVFVQGQGIDLGHLSGLSDVDDGDTINFPPGTEVTVDIPKTQPLSIFNLGYEDDSGFIHDCFWHGIPNPMGCGFCSGGIPTDIPEIFEASPDTWSNAINELQQHFTCTFDQDSLGLINNIYYPPDYGIVDHGYIVVGSSTGDFSLKYTISRQPPVCQGDSLPISGVTSTGSQNTFPPTNAIDNNFSTKWWSTLTVNPSITLDLGSQNNICSVAINWADGNTHPYKFTISVSNDGTNFVNVFSGTSTGTTTAREKYEFPDAQARFVKVTITQSILGSLNSIAQISEIDAYGKAIPPPPPSVTVPNVMHHYAGDAKQIIQNAGLVPKFSHSPQDDSIVTGLSPQAGQSVLPGTTVTMTLHEEEPNCGPNPC